MRHRAVTREAGYEYVALSGEGPGEGTAASQLEALFDLYAEMLSEDGMSLANTVRTRLWARDRPSRDEGSAVRGRTLAGAARSASSSYIAPGRFETSALVGLDLLAVRPANPDARKVTVEYDPPANPIQFLTYGHLVVLSGLTGVLPTLAEQVAHITRRAGEMLPQAGSSWEEVTDVRCYLRHDKTVAEADKLLTEHFPARPPTIRFEHVDNYSADGKFLEVEINATRQPHDS